MRVRYSWILTLCVFCFASLNFFSFFLIATESESLVVVNETNATALDSNTSLVRSNDDSIANMLDRALEREFPENEQNEGNDAGSFNNSVNEQQAVLETVARVKPKKNESKEEKSFQLHDVFNLDNENRAEEMATLIDRKDNVFIISNPKSKFPILQLDLRLISDLVVVIVSATCGGIAFACAGQPVITGYLLAGSVIGPGGLSFVSEMVQVETVAQFGVIFLLFALGLEFSTTKLRVVRGVAVLGGLLQIFLFMCLSGITALLCGGKSSEGVFVGAFLSMSSTAVVLKFLMERNNISALHGQVTIGTLILQDCAVGLLFALLPVLGGTSGVLQGVISMTKSLVVLITFLAVLSILCRTCVPWFLKLMISLSSQTNELYQLASVAFCLLVAWCSDKLGLSLELGSFAAGVMISTTDLGQHTLEQVEPIRNFFAALFLASIGMLIHVHFLWNHVDILLAAVILVIVIKTIVVASVVKGFGYNNKNSLLVGMSLAQIGEFAFVLLSRASNLHLVEGKLYLLLLGTTALSLVTTPLLFKLIPAVVHLGVLLRWFPPENPSEVTKSAKEVESVKVYPIGKRFTRCLLSLRISAQEGSANLMPAEMKPSLAW
ncbi:K(+) efflux antiporter [Quillaja saponaria]|uniref:K(+) efflux antiporter n=1 Tax=Quillaja saponaria TaxID=32244 RepID=A0AAD7VFK4_QUISA|nr:K(+) efflux antiporter [Quillaja saponaria]